MNHQISFEAWKAQLRQDCEKDGKLMAFDALGDYVLELLWQSQVEPTVNAISNDTDSLDRIAGDEPKRIR